MTTMTRTRNATMTRTNVNLTLASLAGLLTVAVSVWAALPLVGLLIGRVASRLVA